MTVPLSKLLKLKTYIAEQWLADSVRGSAGQGADSGGGGRLQPRCVAAAFKENRCMEILSRRRDREHCG
jgi:hypothetical protein